MTSCWLDPRLQARFRHEFVQKFKDSRNPYSVDKMDYGELIKKTGDIFENMAKKTFEVKDYKMPTGEWVVRLVDRKEGRVLLPLEETFSEIDSSHIKGNHKAKTPLHNQLKQEFYNITMPMIEFVIEHCCGKTPQKTADDEQVPTEPTPNTVVVPNELSKTIVEHRSESRKQTMDVPQDPRSGGRKQQGPNQLELEEVASRAVKGISNVLTKSASSSAVTNQPVPSASNFALENSREVYGKQQTFSSTAPSSKFDVWGGNKQRTQQQRMPTMLTSTPIDQNRALPKPRFAVPLTSQSAFTIPSNNLDESFNDSGFSVKSNFLRFLNNSKMNEADANQSTQQYLNIISEQPSPINKTQSLNTECSGKQSDVNRFTSESAGKQTDSSTIEKQNIELRSIQNQVEKDTSLSSSTTLQQPIANTQIKKEPIDYEFALSTIKYKEENMKNPDFQQILMELARTEFGGWRLVQSKCNANRFYFYCKRTGKSQNEEPEAWIEEVKKRKEENLSEVEELRQMQTILQSENNHPAEQQESDEQLRPFNSTEEAFNIIFQDQPQPATNAGNDEYLRNVYEQFENELAMGDEIEFEGMEVLDQGTIETAKSNSGEKTANANENVANESENAMNLDNVPLDDELMVPQPNLERQSMVIEQQPNVSVEATPMADIGKGQSMEEIAANAFVIMAQQQVVEQDQRQAQVVGMGKTTNTVGTGEQEEEIDVTTVENTTEEPPKIAQRKPQTARKRSFPVRKVSVKKSQASDEFRDEEIRTKRPPPFLVPMMPQCYVTVEKLPKHITVGVIQNLLKRCQREMSADELIDRSGSRWKTAQPPPMKRSKRYIKKEVDSNFTCSSAVNTPFNNSRSSPTHFTTVHQDIYRCFECMDSFVDEQAYQWHAITRHKNCVTANPSVIEKMHRLRAFHLKEMNFTCLPCDMHLECEQFWEHRKEKHDEQIGNNHASITKTILNLKNAKTLYSKLRIKKEEPVSDSEESDAQDISWRGKDDEWKRLEVKKNIEKRGGKKGVQTKGRGGKRRLIKIEATEDEKDDGQHQPEGSAGSNGLEAMDLEQPLLDNSTQNAHQNTSDNGMVVVVVGSSTLSDGRDQASKNNGILTEPINSDEGNAEVPCSSNSIELSGSSSSGGRVRRNSGNRCKYCQRSFRDKDEFTAHVSREHLKEIMAQSRREK